MCMNAQKYQQTLRQVNLVKDFYGLIEFERVFVVLRYLDSYDRGVGSNHCSRTASDHRVGLSFGFWC